MPNSNSISNEMELLEVLNSAIGKAISIKCNEESVSGGELASYFYEKDKDDIRVGMLSVFYANAVLPVEYNFTLDYVDRIEIVLV